MSCLVESIAEAMKNLPILSTYAGAVSEEFLTKREFNAHQKEGRCKMAPGLIRTAIGDGYSKKTWEGT